VWNFLLAILAAGCGARSPAPDTKIDLQPPSAPRSEWETPGPAYGMPLDIQITAPAVPEEIRGPSPPIPPGTPMPGGVLESLMKVSGDH